MLSDPQCEASGFGLWLLLLFMLLTPSLVTSNISSSYSVLTEYFFFLSLQSKLNIVSWIDFLIQSQLHKNKQNHLSLVSNELLSYLVNLILSGHFSLILV